MRPPDIPSISHLLCHHRSSIWDVLDILKFLAFYLGGFSGMASQILYSWVSRTLAVNYGERGLIIPSMLTFGFCTQI